MPRAYALGKRATQRAETRRRIVDAAIGLYQEQGISRTTMQDVARRADVAPGTVANHFGSAEALATEATTRILADLRMPGPALFDGVDHLADRIRALVGELAAFYERGTSWYRVMQMEAGDAQPWTDVEARYRRELDVLVRAALGSLAGDAGAVAVVTAILGTWVIGAVQAAGRSGEEAVDLVSDLLATWLATRPPS